MIGIIFYILCGIAASCILYFSFLKDWYQSYQEDYRKDNKQLHYTVLYMGVPMVLLGGFISLIVEIIMFKLHNLPITLYFKIPKINETY